MEQVTREEALIVAQQITARNLDPKKSPYMMCSCMTLDIGTVVQGEHDGQVYIISRIVELEPATVHNPIHNVNVHLPRRRIYGRVVQHFEDPLSVDDDSPRYPLGKQVVVIDFAADFLSQVVLVDHTNLVTELQETYNEVIANSSFNSSVPPTVREHRIMEAFRKRLYDDRYDNDIELQVPAELVPVGAIIKHRMSKQITRVASVNDNNDIIQVHFTVIDPGHSISIDPSRNLKMGDTYSRNLMVGTPVGVLVNSTLRALK